MFKACMDAAAERKPSATHAAMHKVKNEVEKLLPLPVPPGNHPTGASESSGVGTRSSTSGGGGTTEGLKPPHAPTGPDAEPTSTRPAALPPSGIPLKLYNFGLKRLDQCTQQQLLMWLHENGLKQPNRDEKDMKGYAKQQL
eukprot:781299-Pleurochrysis_carterae.AAC.1